MYKQVTIQDKTLEVDYRIERGERGTFVHGGGGSPPIPDREIVEKVSYKGFDVTSFIEYLGLMPDVELQIQN